MAGFPFFRLDFLLAESGLRDAFYDIARIFPFLEVL
jgi:hypothetical protein